MLIFTPRQTEELLSIIDKHHAFFTAANIGTDYLSQHEKQVLTDSGFDLAKFKDSKGKVDEAFSFGLLSVALGDSRVKGMNYKDFRKFMQSSNYMPLIKREQAAIDHLKYQAHTDARSLSNRVKDDVTKIILNEDKVHRTKFDEVTRDAAIKTIEMRGSVRDMISEIGHKTGQWEGNLGMIAESTLHNAYEEGRAAEMENKAGGEEVYVYKDVYPGACKHCIKHYLTGGLGSQPVIFKLSELKANGSNIGRKAPDWLPTLGALHPYCRCTINEVQKGYVWNEDSKSFERGRYEAKSEKVRNRKKVSIKIGNKEYEV